MYRINNFRIKYHLPIRFWKESVDYFTLCVGSKLTDVIANELNLGNGTRFFSIISIGTPCIISFILLSWEKYSWQKCLQTPIWIFVKKNITYLSCKHSQNQTKTGGCLNDVFFYEILKSIAQTKSCHLSNQLSTKVFLFVFWFTPIWFFKPNTATNPKVKIHAKNQKFRLRCYMQGYITIYSSFCWCHLNANWQIFRKMLHIIGL